MDDSSHVDTRGDSPHDWPILLCWAEWYCREHNLAVRTLFRKLTNLPITYQKDLIPSTKAGTPGATLRTNLKTFIQSSKNIKLDLTTTEQIYNWFWLHISEEQKKKCHIRSLHIYDASAYQQPMVIVGVDELKDGTELEILSLFEDCKKLDPLQRPWRVIQFGRTSMFNSIA